VQELSDEATMEILQSLRARAVRDRGVEFADESVPLILLLAKQYLRNRYLPDKAIDILEQCAAYAMLNQVAMVTPEVVHDVVERMVSIPVALDSELSARLEEVKECLVVEAFCPEQIAEEIKDRLEVTMRSLDVSPSRPNAILLTAGTPGQAPELVADVIARALYGGSGRLIEVDMTRFTHASDVNWLTGAPPGYVGHDNALAFQLALAQRPFSVLVFKSVDASHPQVQVALAQALRSGYFTNNRGRKVYLSDAVVVMTIFTEGREAVKPLGFLGVQDERETLEARALPPVSSYVVPELAAEADVSYRPTHPQAENTRTWIERWVLPPVSECYEQYGLKLEWDPSILKWLSNAILEAGDLTKGGWLLEEKVLPKILPYLRQATKVVLSCEKDGSVQIRVSKGG
jgi:ATP-dependent Clp protease ATP-binding subunit ClpC